MRKYHVFSIALILLSIAFAFFKFTPSGVRTWQAMQDITRSVGCIFSENVTPTVNRIPSKMDVVLPLTVEEFKAVCVDTGKRFITLSNVGAYFSWLVMFVLIVIAVAVVLALMGVIAFFIGRAIYDDIDNDHNVDSKPLQLWDRMLKKYWYPLKDCFIEYLVFLVGHKVYIYVFALVWAWNLNLLTIAIEFIAFFIYLLKSGDLGNLFVQIAKFAVDITVALPYLIIPALYLAYKIFDNRRREEGFEILEAEEAHNVEVLEEHPGNLLLTGKPRVGKTKLSTYLQKLYGKIFRREAKESSFDRKMQFPFFPWKVLEQSIIEMRKRVPTFCLEFIRGWMEYMEEQYNGELSAPQDFEVLQEIGYQGHDFIFDYEVERYGMTYNDNVRFVPLWETISLYAQEFYVYTDPKPLEFGNYPVRVYTRWLDYGNYPVIDEENNVFRATPEELEAYSQFNHKYFFDMGRLGVKKDKEGKYNNNFEYGVVGIAEAGKEYGNQKTNKGQATEGECNPVNDLAVLNAKMQGQGSTIGYNPYYIMVMDEQRPGSLQSDLLDLGSEMKVLHREKAEIKMPHFELEAAVYKKAREIMTKFLDWMDVRHGRNTLIVRLAMYVYIPIHNHYVRVYNQFSSEAITIKVLDHSNGEKLEDSAPQVIYVPNREIANAYDTAYFATIYQNKAAKSKTGGNGQVPQYTSLKPEIKDMREVGSHFYDKILKYFDMDDREE